MRRADREITDKQTIENILQEAEFMRLAMVDEGEPYIVALNYVYMDGFLYMHSANEGRKIEIIKRNNRVAFQTDKGAELVLVEETHRCTTKYMSIFGTGRAFLINEKEEKEKVLDAIMIKHTGKAGSEYPEQVLGRTLIIKVEIESITGKNSGY